jgi:hypothetical protein
VIAGRWVRSVVLKRDLFSVVERGRFDGVDAVVRRINEVPWWSFLPALHFLRREASALRAVGQLGIAPELLFAGRRVLVRRFIDGVPMHIARPVGDRAYFRSARAALRKLHAHGYSHNDLAKQQNWLRGPNGLAYLTDFQLSTRLYGRLFRVAAYEDIRHYLQHKRTYVPEALTATEKRILARKSFIASIWLKTGKKVYVAITRGIFRFTDREGGGPRLVNDAPVIAETLKTRPDVSEVVVLAFPDRRSGVGLYAFVESTASEDVIRSFLDDSVGRASAPERLQPVAALPRRSDGTPRIELLQLIAMNQVDQIDALIVDETERRIVGKIVADRRNLRDRFNF